MTFTDLGLSEAILRAIADEGYTSPTPIQARAIPAVLAGGDLLAAAQTGTCKTAGFVLPILQRLATGAVARPQASRKPGKEAARTWPPRALILVPTRELAAQVTESVRVYGAQLPLRAVSVYGGVGIGPQVASLRRGADIVVATPGRLLDLHRQRAIDLSCIEVLVLDEADRMLDMGFIHDLKRIVALLPAERQTLLFSATFSTEIKALAAGFLKQPTTIEIGARNAPADVVAQTVHPVDRPRKRELLSHLIRERNWYQVLVFTRTKHGADKLAYQLQSEDIRALAIHGNKTQGARSRALADFKTGKLQVLVATDIAARGIDIDQLPQVVNYDLPTQPEDYVHRIGRTGRAGASGHAVSLVCGDERGQLAGIERLIKRRLQCEIVPGFEPGREQGRAVYDAESGARPKHKPFVPREAKAPAHKNGAPHARGNGQGYAGKAQTRSDRRDHNAPRGQPVAGPANRGKTPAATATGGRQDARRRPASGERRRVVQENRG